MKKTEFYDPSSSHPGWLTIKERIRDWWRGYRDDDIDSAWAKWSNAALGACVPMTNREAQAFLSEGLYELPRAPLAEP